MGFIFLNITTGTCFGDAEITGVENAGVEIARVDKVWQALVFTAQRLAKRGICRRRVSVCLSVCVCVCPSHSGIVSKRLNVGSRK